MQHTFDVCGKTFVGRSFPGNSAISIFRDADSQFMAVYVSDSAAHPRDSRTGYWSVLGL